MNQEILERLNSRVKANDVLYFLGDFCIGPKARAAELRHLIRCKKIFALAGNHDKESRKLTQEFTWLNDLAEVSLNGQRIVLCHYAMNGIPMESCRPLILHFRWMLEWILTIFVRGTSTKSKIE